MSLNDLVLLIIHYWFIGCRRYFASTNISGGEEITEVSRGGNGNSSSSESGSLGIPANLILPISPPSTTTASIFVPLRGDPFVEQVGPTTPLPPTAKAVDFLVRILMTSFFVTLSEKPIYMLPKSSVSGGGH